MTHTGPVKNHRNAHDDFEVNSCLHACVPPSEKWSQRKQSNDAAATLPAARRANVEITVRACAIGDQAGLCAGRSAGAAARVRGETPLRPSRAYLANNSGARPLDDHQAGRSEK